MRPILAVFFLSILLTGCAHYVDNVPSDFNAMELQGRSILVIEPRVRIGKEDPFSGQNEWSPSPRPRLTFFLKRRTSDPFAPSVILEADRKGLTFSILPPGTYQLNRIVFEDLRQKKFSKFEIRMNHVFTVEPSKAVYVGTVDIGIDPDMGGAFHVAIHDNFDSVKERFYEREKEGTGFLLWKQIMSEVPTKRSLERK